jgi:hypothetical protein
MSDTTDLERRFAVMLAELEDEATRLVQRHAALLREAGEVETELQRVEGVRSAILGKPPRRKSATAAPSSTATVRERDKAASNERVANIKNYARANGGKFIGREAADHIGMAFQGIGPVLAGMVRRGEATVEEPEDGGPRVYTLVGE